MSKTKKSKPASKAKPAAAKTKTRAAAPKASLARVSGSNPTIKNN